MEIREIIEKAKKLELVNDKKEEVFDFTTLSLDEFYNYGKGTKLEILRNILVLPLLLLHELFHIIFGLLFSRKVTEFNTVKYNSKNFYASVEFNRLFSKSMIENLLVNLSPILIVIISLFLSFYNTYFIILLVYVLVSYKYSFPSKIDVYHTLLYKYEKEFDTVSQYLMFANYMSEKYSVLDLLKINLKCIDI